MPAVKKIDDAHVVHRVRVEIEARSRSVAEEAQDAFSGCLRDEFPGLLERWFEARFPPGTHWRKERLELNLGRIPARNLRTELARALEVALDSMERSIVNERGRSNRIALNGGSSGTQPLDLERQERLGSPEGEFVIAFAHFLETGTLPWWFPLARWRTEIPAALLEEEVLAALRAEIRPILGERPHVGVRLLAFPLLVTKLFETEVPLLAQAGWFTTLVEKLPERERRRLELALLLTQFFSAPDVSVTLKLAIRELAGSGGEASRSLWIELLRKAEHESSLPLTEGASLMRRVAGIVSNASDAVELETPVARADESMVEQAAGLEEGLPTEASGLVIFHPFLPQFFKLLGWLSPVQRLLPSRRWHAAQALHWLAHERLARDEAELVLEKTLCGIELNETGELPELEPAVTEEGLELLRSVIAHWGALRNTSPNGLREAFLIRPGVLYLGEKNVLRVEGRGYDILLRRLPYSIETVLLPWLKQPLQVGWENV